MSESQALLGAIWVSTSYLQQFVDVTEYDTSPIKATIQTFTYTPALNDYRIEYLAISQNQLILKDNYFLASVGTSNSSYAGIRSTNVNMNTRGSSVNIFMYVFAFDDYTQTTTRTTYNTIDALTATGGFASVIMLIFKILTS